ncbi:MAG: HisA/HisF-related TIM barrel protein, partial [Bacteroidales bacterium]
CYENKGVHYVICTDIDKDGMLEGPSYTLYREILAKTGVMLIASGGVSSMDDLLRLKEIGCEGAIIGKALYEGKIKLQELEKIC